MSCTCSFCDKKIIIKKRILSDGSYICNSCFSKIPSELRNYALTCWNAADYQDCMEYKRYSDEQLAPGFRKTYSFGPVIVDEEKGLYRLSSNSMVYKVEFLQGINFTFKPEHIKKSVLAPPSATGECHAQFISMLPEFNIDVMLSSMINTTGYMDGRVFNFRLPDKAIELSTKFSGIKESIASKKKAQRTQKARQERKRQQEEQEKETDRLIMAMGLFMLNDLNGIKESDIKKRRNNLLKVFHPDEGETDQEYSQKINDAYEILLKRYKEIHRGQ